MSSDQSAGPIWRTNELHLQNAIWEVHRDLSIEQINQIVKLVRLAETDAHFHGRRSVQRTIISALDIQHLTPRRGNNNG